MNTLPINFLFLLQQQVIIQPEKKHDSTLLQIEALERIEESCETDVAIERTASPTLQLTKTERLTDYPVSASPDSLRSHSPFGGSRRSSLSAVSESSLTSEGSHSFDISRKPNRRILKNPHRPRRRSTNRVRWKLENDSDSTSQDSFEMTASIDPSAVYQTVRNGIEEAREHWQEFEQSPAKGSTGLTPAKPQQLVGGDSLSVLQVSINEGNNNHFPKSPSSLLRPPAVTSPPHSPSPTPSSLTPSSNSSPSSSYTSSPLHQPSGLPTAPLSLRRVQSADASAALLEYYASRVRRSPSHERSSSADESSSTVFDVSVLKIDSSHLSELETSTPGGKGRRQLFKFPQNSDKSFRSADDEDDYDHLRPRESTPIGGNLESPFPAYISPLLQNGYAKYGIRQTSTRNTRPLYSEGDIDEAMEELVWDKKKGGVPKMVSRKRQMLPNGTPSTVDQSQPDRETTTNDHAQRCTSPPLSEQDTGRPLALESRPMVPKMGALQGQHLAPGKKDLPPPPVPPRLRRMSSPSHLKGKYKPLPPLPEVEEKSTASPNSSSVLITQSSQNSSQGSSDYSDVVLDPPLEFSTPPSSNASCEGNSQPSSITSSEAASSPAEDGLTSVSSTTLIADQDNSYSHQDVDPYAQSFASASRKSPSERGHAAGHHMALSHLHTSSSAKMSAENEKQKNDSEMASKVDKRTLRIPSSGSDSSLDENALRIQSATVSSSPMMPTSTQSYSTSSWPRPSMAARIGRYLSSPPQGSRPTSPPSVPRPGIAHSRIIPTSTQSQASRPTTGTLPMPHSAQSRMRLTNPPLPDTGTTSPPPYTRPHLVPSQVIQTNTLPAPRPTSPTQTTTCVYSTQSQRLHDRPTSPQPKITRPTTPNQTGRPHSAQPQRIGDRPTSPQPQIARPTTPNQTSIPHRAQSLRFSDRPTSPQPQVSTHVSPTQSSILRSAQSQNDHVSVNSKPQATQPTRSSLPAIRPQGAQMHNIHDRPIIPPHRGSRSVSPTPMNGHHRAQSHPISNRNTLTESASSAHTSSNHSAGRPTNPPLRPLSPQYHVDAHHGPHSYQARHNRVKSATPTSRSTTPTPRSTTPTPRSTTPTPRSTTPTPRPISPQSRVNPPQTPTSQLDRAHSPVQRPISPQAYVNSTRPVSPTARCVSPQPEMARQTNALQRKIASMRSQSPPPGMPQGRAYTTRPLSPSQLESASSLQYGSQNPQSYHSASSSDSHKYKLSLLTAYTEGNLLHEQSHPHQDHNPTSYPPRHLGAMGQKHTRANPGRTSAMQGRISSEDQHVMTTFYSGNKLPAMTPVSYDTERTIDDMLADLETESTVSGEERERGLPYGE